MNSKLEKFIDKPFQHLHPQSKYAVLISSSKGNYIKPHRDILRAINYKLRFVCRGGATFAKQFRWLESNLEFLVHRHNQVVVIVWLGTCDLTEKSEKFISLRHSTDDAAFQYVTSQVVRFCSFAEKFPSVKLVFFEIPPYSIVEWNTYQGHENPVEFHADDTVLNDRIILINQFIAQVNKARNFCSPRFHLDVTKSKKQKDGQQRKSLDFSLFKDGIHPDVLLARYWMKRLVCKLIELC